ncbi:unnamed protein product, partial [Rotaria socialis]
SGEIFLESNPPELIRRPSAQGPITYRQNISVNFLQPPSVFHHQNYWLSKKFDQYKYESRCHNILTLGIIDIPVTISIQLDI